MMPTRQHIRYTPFMPLRYAIAFVFLSIGYITFQVQAQDKDITKPASSMPSSPSGMLSHTRSPVFSWVGVTQASWYQLWIEKEGVLHKEIWIDGNIRWKAEDDLPCGKYIWWIRTWNQAGFGPWSTPRTFEIECCTPARIMQIEPTLVSQSPPFGRKVTDSTVTYSWQAQACSPSYLIWINRNGAFWFRKWLTAGFQEGQLSETIEGHPLGTYTWWIQSWSPDGYVRWSQPSSFDLGKVNGLDYQEEDSFTKKLRWDNQSSAFAEWFYIWINHENKMFSRKWVPIDETDADGPERWYLLSDDLPIGSYTWWVQTWHANGGLGPWSDAGRFEVIDNNPSSILQDARQKWEQFGPKSYAVEQAKFCFCPPPYLVKLIVKDGLLIDLEYDESTLPFGSVSLDDYMTIDELFGFLEFKLAQSPDRFDVTYDAILGYPKSIFIDMESRISDEEISMRLSNLEVLIFD